MTSARARRAIGVAAIVLLVSGTELWAQRPVTPDQPAKGNGERPKAMRPGGFGGGREAARPGDRVARPEGAPGGGAREPRGPMMFPGGAGAMFRGRPDAGPGGLGVILRNFEVFDTDHDGSLSQQEFEAATREIFARLDANGDGKMDRTELTHDLSALFVRPSTRARQLLRQYDLNHDGKITPEECLLPPKAFAELDANKSGELENDDLVKLSLSQAVLLQDPGRRAAALLAELDKNGDKKLSADEFPFGKTAFSQADANGDGVLDETELKALPPLSLDHPQRRAEALIAQMDEDGDKMLSQNEFRFPGARFEDVDTNHDGLIEARELAAWFEAGNGRFGPTSPAEMVDAILDRYDRNGDGKITADECEGLPEAMRQRWDLNGDGVIEATELEKALSTRRGPAAGGAGGGAMMGGPRGGARAELLRGNPADIVKALDQDGDGKLTAAELGVDQRLFQRIDRDGDGKVTVEELAAAQDLLRNHGAALQERTRDRVKAGHSEKR